MGKGLGNLMKQAQMVQQKMGRLQEEMEGKQVEATAGGGMVTAVVNGRQKLVALKIDPQVVDADDVDMLQDLISAAVNEAIHKSQKLMQDEMSKLTGGFNLPGLF